MDLPDRVTVIGAGGTMGGGIAATFAAAGCAVTGVVSRPGREDAARVRAGAVADRITYTADLDAGLDGADLVIESVAESLAAKTPVLSRAAERCPAAIIVTNTSSLPIAALASAVSRPERFAAYHWINPPELIEVIEIVPVAETAPTTIASLVAWSETIGKLPVVLGRDVPGFILNRLQYAVMREAWNLVEGGVCSFADVDATVTRALGARWAAVGPFAVMDLAGLDIHLAVAEQMFPAIGGPREVPTSLVDAVRRGDLGVKSGRGLLGEYTPAARAELVERRARILAAIGDAR
jgi:3-hydroxybutyryl-CoA dehydrogenase